MRTLTRRFRGFTLVEIMIVVAIIGIITAIVVPAVLRGRENARGRACQENLAQIDAAVRQWALDNHQPNGASVELATLVGPSLYLHRMPTCPSGGNYPQTLTVGITPTCSIGESNAPYVSHIIPGPTNAVVATPSSLETVTVYVLTFNDTGTPMGVQAIEVTPTDTALAVLATVGSPAR